MKSGPSILSPEEYALAVAGNYVRTLSQREAMKGPHPTISPAPVQLELPFEAVFEATYNIRTPIPQPAPYDGDPRDIHHYQIWPHKGDDYELENQEDILTALGPTFAPITYEILATPEKTRFMYHCEECDSPLVLGAYQSRLTRAQASELEIDPLHSFLQEQFKAIARERLALVFVAAFPPAGLSYAEMLTPADSFASNTYASFFQMVTELDPDECMVSGVMFTPCALGHDWQRNIEFLNREVFKARESGSIFPSASQFPQQTPDNYLPHAASDTRRKADRDQGFLAVNLYMAGVFRPERSERFTRGFQAYFSQFRFGGRPLRFLTYQHRPESPGALDFAVDVLCSRLPRWQGWILSTGEAVSFTQIPMGLDLISQGTVTVDCQSNTEVPSDLREGDHILAYVEAMGKPTPVYLPKGDNS